MNLCTEVNAFPYVSISSLLSTVSPLPCVKLHLVFLQTFYLSVATSQLQRLRIRSFMFMRCINLYDDTDINVLPGNHRFTRSQDCYTMSCRCRTRESRQKKDSTAAQRSLVRLRSCVSSMTSEFSTTPGRRPIIPMITAFISHSSVSVTADDKLIV